ncbi:MAG: CPBP family intramembrane metalloprotease [Clostridia bacterium]|nr:CPBP family intramembrane metalloprotease [Clostridia bacterium]
MVVRQKNPVGTVTLIIFAVLNITGLFSDKITAFLGIDSYSFYFLLYIVCFLIPIVFLALYNRKSIKITGYLKLKNFKLRYLPVCISASVAATFFSMLINAGISALFKIESSGKLPSAIGELEFGGILSVAVALVVLPAILEELYFRGAYCSQYSEFPRIEVILAAAISFTVLHGSLQNLVSPFICSIVYSLLVYLSGSVWAAIIAHAVNNMLAVTAAYYADIIAKSELKWIIFVTLLLIFFISLYFTLRFFEKHYLKSKKKRKGVSLKEAKRSRNRATPFTKSFFLLIALFILKTVLELTGLWA